MTTRIERTERAVASGAALVDPDPHRPCAATLWINEVPQSYVDLADPTILSFEYVRQIGDVIDIAFPAGRPVDAVHLGGGALTIPRYIAATRPRSRQRVAEIDPLLVDLVRDVLPIPPSCGIRVSAVDARVMVERMRPATADVIVLDAFDGGRLPRSLASVEAFGLLARTVRPNGVVITNLADGRPLDFMRSMIVTAKTAFRSLAVAAEPSVWRGRRFGNFILIASDVDLPADILRRRLAGGMFPARLVAGAELVEFAAGAPVRTDRDDAPTPRPPPQVFAPLRRSSDGQLTTAAGRRQ